jgi:hypothetical protein
MYADSPQTLWAVEASVFRLLLLLVLRKQVLCAFLSLIFLCGWCVAYVGDVSKKPLFVN